jgi:hypothetical protein
MADVVELGLVGKVQNIVDESRDIIVANLIPAEPPEGAIMAVRI